jgi:putative solute:sodium symporter small subunit
MTEEPDKKIASLYWSANLRLLFALFSIWFTISFGAGILFRDWLDQFMFVGYPLGFWFAQQGSIYAFICLIFYYNHKVHKIEKLYQVDDDGDLKS